MFVNLYIYANGYHVTVRRTFISNTLCTCCKLQLLHTIRVELLLKLHFVHVDLNFKLVPQK